MPPRGVYAGLPSLMGPLSPLDCPLPSMVAITFAALALRDRVIGPTLSAALPLIRGLAIVSGLSAGRAEPEPTGLGGGRADAAA